MGWGERVEEKVDGDRGERGRGENGNAPTPHAFVNPRINLLNKKH